MALGRDEYGFSIVSTDGKVEVLVAGSPDTRITELFDPVSVSWSNAARMAHTDFRPSMVVAEGLPTVMSGYQ